MSRREIGASPRSSPCSARSRPDGRLILREEAGGAGAQRAQERVAVGAGAEHDDLDARMRLDHLRDARDAVAVGEHEVEQDDVGLELCGHAHGVGADRGAAEHGEGAICEHGDESPPIQVVVLSDENRNPSRGVFQRAPPRVHTREFHPSEGGPQPPTSPWSWPVYPPDRGSLLVCSAQSGTQRRDTRTRLTVTATSSNSRPERRVGLVHRHRGALERHAGEQRVGDVGRQTLDQVEARGRGDLDRQRVRRRRRRRCRRGGRSRSRATSSARARGRARSAARARARARARRDGRARASPRTSIVSGCGHATPSSARSTARASAVGAHVVHAQEVGAAAVAVERGRNRGGHAVGGDLAAGERAQEALARDAEQQRAEPRQARQRAQQREVVRERLAEADAGVERDALARQCRPPRPPRRARPGSSRPRRRRRRSAGRPASCAARRACASGTGRRPRRRRPRPCPDRRAAPSRR